MYYKTTWHILHAILSLITYGLWIPIWIGCALSNRAHNERNRQMIEDERRRADEQLNTVVASIGRVPYDSQFPIRRREPSITHINGR